MEELIYSPKALGSIVKRQRKAKKLNQKQAGSAFKLEQSTISSIERGAPGTRIGTIFRVLAALELEMIIREKSQAEKLWASLHAPKHKKKPENN